ncbi:5-oxoprolinase subunit C family protein [Nocardia rhamnosiphila]
MTAVLADRAGRAPADRDAVVTVVEPGPASTVQDLGRPGFAHLGITTSGGADRSSLMLANRLLGNVAGAPVIESMFGGLTVALSTDRMIAVAGAPTDLRIDGRPVSEPRTLLRAGQQLRLGFSKWGLRTYLAVQGGIEAGLVFGSASADCLSGLGPRPLRPGDRLSLGDAYGVLPDVPLELVTPRAEPGPLVLRFHWGPRDRLFSPADRAAFTTRCWAVGNSADRVGVRVSGVPLTIGSVDLPSEGMALGAVQIPPSGEPIVFLADHPVTGGYPVIGVVTERDIDRLAQARPGTAVRFSALPRGGA